MTGTPLCNTKNGVKSLTYIFGNHDRIESLTSSSGMLQRRQSKIHVYYLIRRRVHRIRLKEVTPPIGNQLVQVWKTNIRNCKNLLQMSPTEYELSPLVAMKKTFERHIVNPTWIDDMSFESGWTG